MIMVIGDIAFYGELVVHTRILGELLPDKTTVIRLLTGVIIVAAITSLVTSWLHGSMVMDDAFLYYDVPTLVLIIRSMGEACIFIPTAWAFFRRARNIHIAFDALNAYVSAVYLGVALSALHRDLILHGVETPWHVASNVVLFGVLLVAILVVSPPGRHRAQQTATTNL